MTTYQIRNTEGRQGRAWTRTYDSLDEATEALRVELGWDGIVLSDSFATDLGSAVCAYETQEECDADEEGAYAPRIVEVR